jgi:hypothetical protein
VIDADGNPFNQMDVPLHPEHLQAHCNLPSAFLTFPVTITSATDLPADHDGIIVPYLQELALPDHQTIPRFVHTYLYRYLGTSSEAATAYMLELLSDLGVLNATPWGDELAHVLWCIDVALRAQSICKVMVDGAGLYLGCVILGGRFTITIGERVFHPQPRQNLVADYARATPHLAALSRIMVTIEPDAVRRATAIQQTTSAHELRALILSAPLSEAERMLVAGELPQLHFAADPPPLVINSTTICQVLNAIADPSNNGSTLPLLPTMIMENSRQARFWSAFGKLAPSFLCPGGKMMSLEESFEIQRRLPSGAMEPQVVTKIGVIVKPLGNAITDLASMHENHMIQNPHGSAVMSRVSSDSLVKSFEKVGAQNVISALRGFCGIGAVASSSHDNPRKRKADDDAGAGPSKRLLNLDW